MDAGLRSRGLWLLTTLVVAVLPTPFTQAAETVWPLAVHEGQCSCVLPTRGAADKYFLIVSSLARGAGPFRVSIRSEPATGPAFLPLENVVPEGRWAQRIAAFRDRLEGAQHRETAEEHPPVPAPPVQRSFSLFVGDEDFQDRDSYVTVAAELRAVGRHCQVYVDRDCSSARLQPTIDETVRTFDDEVQPWARRWLGGVRDVDRDGRFTILFTPWLGKLQHGKVALGGFVCSSDFDSALIAPFGNRCDMMYLNSDLQPGPHLRSLLAHEYTHAVVYSEHVLERYLPELPAQDEESWLNEALAHLAEDLHGYGWSNLDYRLSAFLDDPQRYALVVPDYYTAGLWRSYGNRGATYLFLRWCVARQGPELLRRLIQTNLTGTANVETATGQPFAELFRQWTVSLVTGGQDWALPRGEPVGRLLCGPHFAELPMSGGRSEQLLAGTSAAFLLLHSPAEPATRLTVTAEPCADLQVSLVRLPEQTGRLTVQVIPEPGPRPDTVRLLLTAHDADLTLTAAVWERLTPTANHASDTSYRPEEGAGAAIDRWFGEPHLPAGQSRSSAPLTLPAGREPLVFKVAATDAAGHRVTGWACLPRGPAQ